jgi:GH24 family phage-related lysozyme (muramidase)
MNYIYFTEYKEFRMSFLKWLISLFKSKSSVDVVRIPPSIPTPKAPSVPTPSVSPTISPRILSINEAGLNLIKEFEGCYLRSYPDPASPLANACRAARISAYTKYTSVENWENISGSPWTIGWGATGPDIGPNMVWTQDQADARLLVELEEHMRYVRDILKEKDLVPTPNQFAALTSFTYNCGPSNLRRILSTGLEGFPDRVLSYNKAQGQVLPGLVRRREAERNLFLEV